MDRGRRWLGIVLGLATLSLALPQGAYAQQSESPAQKDGKRSSAEPPPALPDGATPAKPLVPFYLLVRDDDYPQRALRAEEQGTVGFEIWVNAKGRSERCIVTEGSGSDELDMATCEIVRTRARFKPARSLSGEPLRDRIRSRLGWGLVKG